jgi:RNA polymerase sigma-70 factor (ECF subfamily)
MTLADGIGATTVEAKPRQAATEAQRAASKDELLAAVPKLRGFAVSLCGRTARADDLVQETLMKAWANLNSFQPGSNMVAWLCTILRNEFYSEFRKRRHEVGDEEGRFAARLATRPAQEGHMRLLEFRDALALLADEQLEALILVGASGLSYEEAAAICGCAVGTMKSRASRARAKLAEILNLAPQNPLESDRAWDAAVDKAWTTRGSGEG